MLFASYFFYGTWRPEFLILIAISTLVDYYVGLRMDATAEKRKKKQWLISSIVINLGLLFSFKYLDFLNESFRALFDWLGVSYGVPEFDILLPVGISFYTFQTLSYTIDIYRGKREAERHLGIFAVYVSFFPQLVAGPIERSVTLLPQFRKKIEFQWANISSGVRLILWGMFKKVIIADHFTLIVNEVMSDPQSFSGPALIFNTFCISAWIYSDFTGYTDIAIGSARLLGFHLIPNFHRPFLSKSIGELWQRWHMSLTNWINEYMFFPMTRAAKTSFGRNFAIFLVFLFIGVWHGANWTFVAFGIIHAFYVLSFRHSRKTRKKFTKWIGLNRHQRLKAVIDVSITMFLWGLASIFFRGESLEDCVYIVTHLWSFEGSVWEIQSLSKIELFVSFSSLAVLMFTDFMNTKNLENPFDNIRSTPVRWGFYYFMLFYLLVFSHQAGSSFFYFQF